MRFINSIVACPACAVGLALGATLAGPPPVLAGPPGSLAATRSGNDLILSFPTSGPQFYTVQTSPDLMQWANVPAGIPGDGMVKTVTFPNALPNGQGFYRVLVRTPTKLLLTQSDAFAVLGHSCGGIKEQAYITGFDPATGNPTGSVYLSTTCSTGGRGSPPATFTAWATVTWDLAGNVIASGTLSNAAGSSPTLVATDAYGDSIYNLNAAAYLIVPAPGKPTGVAAVQAGDQFQVSWIPSGVNPAAVSSSTLTATPVNSSAMILTATVSGSATTGVIASLQPQTTYDITVVNTSIGGSSPVSSPLRLTTVAASVPPSAPNGLTAHWTNLNPTGATDTLVAAWQAADPGNSPIDQYLITIVGSDGGGTFTQTVSGTTLTASFDVDWVPNWSVAVQAHNAAGWGPAAGPTSLGGL